MRSSTILARIATAVAVLALAAPAAATHGGIHPTTRSERVYFHCNGPTKIGNINLVTNGAALWDTNAPTASVTEGAGCGNLDPGAQRGSNQNTVYDAQFTGTFTGNLESLTIEAHNLVLSQVDTNNTRRVRLWLTIDGVDVLNWGNSYVDISPELSETGASEKFVFTIPDLGCSREVFDADGNVVDVITDGFVSEDGEGLSERTITLTLDSYYTDRAGAWVYDTTEVPSGITFNPAAPAGPQVAPLDPASCD